ncbi:MAG: cytochrome c [Hyphomicrobiaceae bacterium]
MNMLSRIAILAALMIAPTCRLMAQEEPNRGMEFYLEHCASCHGSDVVNFISSSMKLSTTGSVQTSKGKPVLEFLTTHGPADDRDRREMDGFFAQTLAKSPQSQ